MKLKSTKQPVSQPAVVRMTNANCITNKIYSVLVLISTWIFFSQRLFDALFVSLRFSCDDIFFSGNLYKLHQTHRIHSKLRHQATHFGLMKLQWIK